MYFQQCVAVSVNLSLPKGGYIETGLFYSVSIQSGIDGVTY